MSARPSAIFGGLRCSVFLHNDKKQDTTCKPVVCPLPTSGKHDLTDYCKSRPSDQQFIGDSYTQATAKQPVMASFNLTTFSPNAASEQREQSESLLQLKAFSVLNSKPPPVVTRHQPQSRRLRLEIIRGASDMQRHLKVMDSHRHVRQKPFFCHLRSLLTSIPVLD